MTHTTPNGIITDSKATVRNESESTTTDLARHDVTGLGGRPMDEAAPGLTEPANWPHEARPPAGHQWAWAERAGDRGLDALGRGAHAVADGIRRKGREMDVDHAQLDAVARPIDAAGHYLTSNDPGKVATDIDVAVRKHPYRSMLIGAAAGWLFGRFISR